MSRAAFDAVNYILDTWRILIQCAMFLALWAAVFRRKRGKKDGIAAILLILANIGMGFLPCASWVRYAVSVLAALGYGAVYESSRGMAFTPARAPGTRQFVDIFPLGARAHKRQAGRAVFVALAVYNLHCLSFLISNSIYIEMADMMQDSLDALSDSYLQQMYCCMAVGILFFSIIYMALFAAMTVILCRIVKERAEMAWQDVLLLSVLNVVGSMVANVVGGLVLVRTDGNAFLLFEEKPDLIWKVPMIAALLFAGEAAMIYFWQRYRILLAEREKRFVEEQQVKAMKKRLEEAENFYGSIRKVRHEMKNHMANIKGLAEAGQYGEMEGYVRKMDATMQELEYKYVTGNAVTDVIINDKCRRAEKAGIRFDADFRYGGEIPVFDLGIILNNLLDNAIEACEKLEPGKGFIRLTLKRKKQFLLLEVENSYGGTVPVQKGGGLVLPTTKQSTLPGIITEHGIGLENVRDVAERYFGGVNIKVKGDMFHVAVMLQQGEVEEEKK